MVMKTRYYSYYFVMIMKVYSIVLTDYYYYLIVYFTITRLNKDYLNLIVDYMFCSCLTDLYACLVILLTYISSVSLL